MDYQEELELAANYAASTLPRDAYGAASYSLHYGPSGGGADMTWEEAIAALRAWADTISDVTLTEYGYDDDGEEYEYEVGCIDASDIIRGVIGKEMASYL